MTGYARGEADFAADRYRRDARPASISKDYSVPLHVDCSIEYELPDCAKPPQGVKIEPLLMIHPSHFRRLESLRRVPFVNNLPRGEPAAARARAPRARRCCRGAPAPAAACPAGPAPACPAAACPAACPARPRLAEEPPCWRAEEAGGRAARARQKAHPYLPPETLDCDMARLPPAPYDRFDKRALQQLPIYM